MSKEEGDYTDEAKAILKKQEADGVIIIVMGGTRGHGFSVATKNPQIIKLAPSMLRLVAGDMEIQNETSVLQ